jgi:hypothetical protein
VETNAAHACALLVWPQGPAGSTDTRGHFLAGLTDRGGACAPSWSGGCQPIVSVIACRTWPGSVPVV